MTIQVLPVPIRTMLHQLYICPPRSLPQLPERKHEFSTMAPGPDDQDQPKELYKIECKCRATTLLSCLPMPKAVNAENAVSVSLLSGLHLRKLEIIISKQHWPQIDIG